MDLESHDFISFFEPQDAAELCQVAIVEFFPHQKVLFDEGDGSDFLYLVLEGEVEFRKHIGSNQFRSLSKALPNGYFGELGILDGQPRSMQAIVRAGSTLARIPRDRLMEILQTTKGRAVLNLMGYTVERLRDNTDKYMQQLLHKEKMVLIGEMLNTIIHDFKSPLSGIHLSTGMVKELHPDEETAEWCDLIQAQATRMSAMAEELLAFAGGNTVLHKQPVNLATALQRFEKLNDLYLQEARVELTIQGEDVMVFADENKLLRVWQNLVTNAVEAFNNNGGSIEIVARATAEGAQITIADNGSGIPEAIRENFFEPFVTHGKRGGTGLGTAIAKSIIDAHGGRIYFETSKKGTTFYIHLPLLKKVEG